MYRPYTSLKCSTCGIQRAKKNPKFRLKEINGYFYCERCADQHRRLLKPQPGAIQRTKTPPGIVVVNPPRQA